MTEGVARHENAGHEIATHFSILRIFAMTSVCPIFYADIQMVICDN